LKRVCVGVRPGVMSYGGFIPLLPACGCSITTHRGRACRCHVFPSNRVEMFGPTPTLLVLCSFRVCVLAALYGCNLPESPCLSDPPLCSLLEEDYVPPPSCFGPLRRKSGRYHVNRFPPRNIAHQCEGSARKCDNNECFASDFPVSSLV